ncbi:toprim domain-containing protein [Sphingobacterium sp. HJSM2_6]|uniref:toprim domain-containing protein n=1 Tax=Sphingobacterium sp. HJSM2_6 TaxID=3366264 RepID=UPI003BDC1CBF
MNCEQAKKIDLKKFLIENFEFQIEYSRGHEHWGKSVFRNERSASMKVNEKFNSFIDFGAVRGKYKASGTIIDFIQCYYQIGVSEALERIKDFSFPQHRKIMIAEEEKSLAKKYLIEGVYDLQNAELLKYLANRGLDLNLCKKFLMEVKYSLIGTSRSFLNVGFRNDLGGYEVNYRIPNNVKTVKRCLGNKAITTFLKQRKEVLLFESWSDFLAYLTIKSHGVDSKYDFIILNSVKNIHIIPDLTQYSSVVTGFDNDLSGKGATNFLAIKYPNSFKSLNHLYADYNDVNDWLIAKNSEKPNFKHGLRNL